MSLLLTACLPSNGKDEKAEDIDHAEGTVQVSIEMDQHLNFDAVKVVFDPEQKEAVRYDSDAAELVEKGSSYRLLLKDGFHSTITLGGKIDMISLSGVFDLDVDELVAEEFYLHIEGAVNGKLGLEAETARIEMEGASHLDLKGKVGTLTLSSKGGERCRRF